MSVFSNIDPTGHEAIVHAVQAVLARAEAMNLRGSARQPWSLVELHPTPDDYTWLLDWAEALPPGQARRWLRGELHIPALRVGGDAAIGLLLLFLFAELARREASESDLWGVLRDHLGAVPCADLLFIKGANYPRPNVQAALRAAADRFSLRHVFNQEADVQAWRGLLFLQFGFSIRGAERQLPLWLSGQWPQNVRRLFRGALRAESFRHLWTALTEFRRSNLPEQQFRRELAQSPWVLPEWHERLASHARKKGNLGTRGLDEEREYPIAVQPRLVWPQGCDPRWQVTLNPDAVLLEENASYRVLAGEDEVARIVVSPLGDQSLEPPGRTIAIPHPAPTLPISIQSADGTVQGSMALELWPAGAEVLVSPWSNNCAGHLRDGDTTELEPHRRYALLAPQDFEIHPQDIPWHSVPHTGLRLHLVHPEVLPRCEFRWNGETVWRPLLKQQAPPPEPAWTLRVQAQYQETAPRQVLVRHPPDVRLVWARCDGQPLGFTAGSAGATTLQLPARPRNATLQFRLGVAGADGTRILCREVECIREGAWLLSASSWNLLEPDAELDVQDLAGRPMKVRLPGTSPEERARWWFLEEDAVLKQLPPGNLRLEAAAGLGGELRLRKDRFNSRDPDIALGRLVDRGWLRSVEPAEPEVWRLRLTGPHEPDPDMQVLWWAYSGECQLLAPTVVTPDEWELAAKAPLAVGIAYGGKRVAAWWNDRWWEMLRDLKPDLDHALLLRWLRLPVLLPRASTALQHFLRSNPAAILRAWISDEVPPPAGLAWNATHDAAWREAARTLFWTWTPDRPKAVRLVEALGSPEEPAEDDDDHPGVACARRALWSLAQWHPLLMARAVHHFSTHQGLLLSTIRQRLVEGEDELLRRCCGAMRDGEAEVDPAFIERGLLGPAVSAARGDGRHSDDERPVRMAIAVEPFRRLLALRLCRELEHTR